jgi:hypothetical protein
MILVNISIRGKNTIPACVVASDKLQRLINLHSYFSKKKRAETKNNMTGRVINIAFRIVFHIIPT